MFKHETNLTHELGAFSLTMATVGSNTEAKITMESHSAFEDKESLSGNKKKKKKVKKKI